MEEYEDVLLKSLQNAGVSIPSNVSSIQDFTSATLVSICAQSVNLLDETASLPSSFPDSLVDKFKICTDIALAIKRLGYIGDMTYYKFLYPSEEDLFKLVRFLVERLSESSVGVKLPDLKDVNSTRKIRVEGSTDNSEDWMEKADDRGLDHQQEKLKNLSLHNIGSELSDSNVEDTSFNRLLAAEGESERVAFQKVTPAKDQSSQMRHESETLQNQEKLLVKEVTARTSELQKLQEELEMLKDAAEMAFDDQHPIEFYVEQLNKQDSKRCNIVELESKWDAFRKPLEEKKRSLEESLYADIPEAQEKLLKLREVELEKQAILSKVRRLEEEHSKLCVDFGKQPKLPTRTSYIERIKEITKNSRKQDADIERILKETRELQLESNSIRECLDRTYAVLDEIVFRSIFPQGSKERPSRAPSVQASH
ncbi:coiled-coil domain-containing protein 22 isoform X2 [Manihot esculenta]|uniref:Uncharacterized protein n=1 Tax=Manihot esculenta TaxID=3983 RepID=A0ACB7G9L5_MANES|nr:coiled-coil domain-containing protein 22 isoform X2 [Manihot esculenta]KAG8636912.1 hypothetical protein MANES_15G057600v8 [Manihot esculenta]